jgi:hypothetical protein
MNLIRDLVLLATIIGFCGILVAYVWLCDRIIGPDPELIPDASSSPDGATPATVGEGGTR